MSIETLAATAIAILSPYLAAGAKKAAEVAGAAVAEQAGKLLSKTRGWFAGDAEAERTLQSYESRPDRYASAVQDILLDKLKINPSMAGELQQIVDAMGGRVEVIQKIRILAGQAIGLDLAKWEKGLAIVNQEVDTIQLGGSLIGVRQGNKSDNP
jgi:hypothetical protein